MLRCLDQLSTHELHDRRCAEREALGREVLLVSAQVIPAAKAASGRRGEADYDIASSKRSDLRRGSQRDGELGESEACVHRLPA